ncbi:unnamed protein product [Caenorhabditis sp. 36 PRJEB53466]|nr:unnamed protein product [Caenorhabditis sp. 36 PRJEB53466]
MEQLMTAEGPINPNFCNSSDILEEAGLIRSTLGQFLGYDCSEEFYHCRWQSDGFRTYRKKCKPGLVYDVLGTQNCNYDYNVKTCGVRSGGPVQCNGTDFYCPLSEQCVPMALRCDGHYDCSMEEDEQNCPLCTSGEFACKASEQCIPIDRRWIVTFVVMVIFIVAKVMNVFIWMRDVMEEDSVLMVKTKCSARNLKWRKNSLANLEILKSLLIKCVMDNLNASMALTKHIVKFLAIRRLHQQYLSRLT